MDISNKNYFISIIGFSKNEKLLSDKKLISTILKNLVEIADMKATREPVITKIENEPGLEGYIPIDTSNITISTFLLTRSIVAGIHTCKNFDYKKVIIYLKDSFDLENVKFFYYTDSDFRPISDVLL